MPQIKFGPLYTRIQDLVGVQGFSAVTERLGFDSLWIPETPVTPEIGLDCLSTLGAFIEHTTNITLGTCVVLLPLRHPAILAKEVATLDYLSGGRVVLGVGVGGEASPAFRVCGVDPRERGARTDEALEIMTKLWTGQKVSHHGRFYQFDEIFMEVTPHYEPNPPIWVGGESEAALRRAARWGDGFVPAGFTPAGYDRAVRKIGRYAEETGRDVSGMTRAAHLYFRIARNKVEAQREANEAIIKRVGSHRVLEGEKSCALGTPADCARTVERFVAAGVEHFIVNPSCSRSEYVPQLERFAAEVMAHFR